MDRCKLSHTGPGGGRQATLEYRQPRNLNEHRTTTKFILIANKRSVNSNNNFIY